MKYYFICPEFGALCHVVFIALRLFTWGSHCDEMRFGNVGSWGERETGVHRKNLLEQREEPTTNQPTYMALTQEFKP